MNTKFYKIKSTSGEPPFTAAMRLSKILYVKLTGNILGVAFSDRPGEILFTFDDEREAILEFNEIKNALRKGKP